MARLWTVSHLLLLVTLASLVLLLGFRLRDLQQESVDLRQRADWPHVGMVVPSFAATTLSGDSAQIAAPPTGERQVLIFFNTRCAYCLASVPAWNDLAETLASSALPDSRVYGISLDGEAETRVYAALHALEFPVVTLSDDRLVRLYRAWAVPMLLVVDFEGIVHQFVPRPLGMKTPHKPGPSGRADRHGR